jgi:hypothetical protein
MSLHRLGPYDFNDQKSVLRSLKSLDRSPEKHPVRPPVQFGLKLAIRRSRKIKPAFEAFRRLHRLLQAQSAKSLEIRPSTGNT